MISFDDLSGGTSVNLNPIYMSLNILSQQQQTFESDLNDMMIDIQMISNSVSTLTGGGSAEYYITASSTNTDKLPFCYNLKDSVVGFSFTDKYIDINMNGYDFKTNTVYNSTTTMSDFKLNGAAYMSGNSFQNISKCDFNGMVAYSNTLSSIQNVFGNCNGISNNTLIENTMEDLKAYGMAKMSISNFTQLNLKFHSMASQTIRGGSMINCLGDSFAGNSFSYDGLVNFRGLTASHNTFTLMTSVSLIANTIGRCAFSSMSNVSLNGYDISWNTIGKAKTFDFSCDDFYANMFDNTMRKIGGYANSMRNNTFLNYVTKFDFSGFYVSSNVFDNITNCNFDVVSFSENVNTNTDNVIQLFNLTAESANYNQLANIKNANFNVASLVENTFTNVSNLNFNGLVFSINSFPSFVGNANIQNETFIGNDFSAVRNLRIDNHICSYNTFSYITNADIRCVSFSENQIEASVFNGMFKGESNRISAIYGNFTGSMNSNVIHVLDGKFEGVLKANLIHASDSENGSIYINNLASAMGLANTVNDCQKVTVIGNRAGYFFSNIKSLWVENMLSNDTFRSVGTIFYSFSRNTPTSNVSYVSAVSHYSFV